VRFWEVPAVPTALTIAALLLAASFVRRSIPFLRRLGIPDSMVAGFVALLLGASALNLLPLDLQTLEIVVYQGLAVIFIAVGLQEPIKTKGGGGAKSVAFALRWRCRCTPALGLCSRWDFSRDRGRPSVWARPGRVRGWWTVDRSG